MIPFTVIFTMIVLSWSPAVVQQGQVNQEKTVKADTVTFAGTIGPILRENCSPCHFEGGKVYDRYPFDKSQTARDLGKRLNTRLKGKNADLVLRWIGNGTPETRDSLKKP